ncbi:MAG: hypothetical protein V1688_04810 [bacterium]
MDNNILQSLATKEDISNVEKCLKEDISNVEKCLKSDINNVRQELKSDINDVRQELKNVRQELKSDIDNVRQELKSDIGDVRQTLSEHSKILSEHGEQLAFIYENGATKDELKNLATKNELNEVKDEVKRVIDKLLDHDDKLDWLKENMVTKEEFRKFLDSQDKVTTMLERLDQERIFTNRNVGRHEEKIEFYDIKIEQHETDIRRIKGVLKLADK